MKNTTLYIHGSSPALLFAGRNLADVFHIVSKPALDVTHLLLPVPAFEKDGRIRGGGVLENILADLRENVMVMGGNLHHPSLAGYPVLDLLQDGEYLARNAALTADCAIRVAGNHLPVGFAGCSALVVGWGRIGKCLAAKLQALGANVAIAARKDADRNMATALGFATENTRQTQNHYRLIFNTVPAPVFQDSPLPKDSLKIELASTSGLAGKDVISALGLPGKIVPEASGALIARRIKTILTERQEHL